MSLLRFIWSQWLVVVLCLHGARVSLITERYKCIYISCISNRPLLCTLIPRYVWKLYNKTHTLHVFLSRHCTWLRKISILARLHGKQRRYFMQKFCRISLRQGVVSRRCHFLISKKKAKGMLFGTPALEKNIYK